MEINKVQILIRGFLFETREVIADKEKSWKWLKDFRDTLQYQGFLEQPLPYALTLLTEAGNFNNKHRISQMIRWARSNLKKDGIENPTKEQIHNKCKELYGDEFEAPIQSESPQQSKTPVVNPQPRRNKPIPKDKQVVIDWAIDNGIDVDDACECWEATTERNGCDQDGNKVKNWEAFVKQWCKTRNLKRKEK